jgi:pimeloyl-ACP methyl ester carboxylesterase
VAQNARSLAEFVADLHADTLHLVGHSMGGLVILELFERFATGALEAARLPHGRIVLLGTPVRGSRAARNLAQNPFGLRMLGLTAHEVLLPYRDQRWYGARDLGIIAGTLPLGLGRLMGPFDAPSDGTVLVEETHLAGAKQHLSLRTTHTGMIYSGAVAHQTATFLRTGAFDC